MSRPIRFRLPKDTPSWLQAIVAVVSIPLSLVALIFGWVAYRAQRDSDSAQRKHNAKELMRDCQDLMDEVTSGLAVLPNEAEKSKLKRVAELADQALTWDPSLPEAHAAKIDALAEMGRLAEAATSLTKAKLAAPETSPILKSESHCLLAAGRFDDAVAGLKRAIELTPDDPELRTWLTLAFVVGGVPPPAQESYWLATVKRFPHARQFRMGLASVLMKQGRLREALDVVRDGRVGHPMEELDVERQICEEMGERACAIRCAMDVVRGFTGGTDERLLVSFAIDTLIKFEELDAAEGAVNRLLATNPSDMFARFRLGQVLESRGEVRKAIEEYERVFDADPSRGMFQMRLPRLLERVGELDKAERRLKSFVALSGESRSSLSILGEFYRRHKRVRELADVEIKLKAARNTVPIPPDQIGREVGKALIGDRWPHCGDRE